ncbi:sigma-70 family RNA polymerase sigma factor [Herbaspirillum sp. NPDC087042]|uniref:sigma-70 family RNA polymerase sigma factor n=1 Tax=Herbaspirillum sp. NPDC087042 TaxID=3364004 RepID=UPI0037FC67C3
MREDSQNLPLLDALMRHYDELVDHVRRRFGDKNFAHEVVHEVYVHVVNARPREQEGTPLALLKHISTCKAIDLQRAANSRNQWQESVDAVPDISQHHIDGEEVLRGKQLVDALENVISDLPPRCREVFVLHKLEELSQDEVATTLGISRKMVVKHMERAMSAIRPVWFGAQDDIGGAALREPLAARLPSGASIARGAAKRRVVRGIATMTAMLLLCSGTAWLVDPAYDTRQVATAVGETSTITMADGSRIHLNTDSEVRVESRLFSRRMTLLRGEAGFDVAHTYRSFVVQAHRTTVTDIGTVFDVRNLEDGARVSVQQGAVEVRSDDGQAQVLLANQAVYSRGGQLERLPDLDADQNGAWRRGKLYFNGTPLREAVRDMQRYLAQPILLSDARIGELRLSGEYDIKDVDDLLRVLPTILPVTVRRGAHTVVIAANPVAARNPSK